MGLHFQVFNGITHTLTANVEFEINLKDKSCQCIGFPYANRTKPFEGFNLLNGISGILFCRANNVCRREFLYAQNFGPVGRFCHFPFTNVSVFFYSSIWLRQKCVTCHFMYNCSKTFSSHHQSSIKIQSGKKQYQFIHSFIYAD